jgi:hypothetical protein
VPEGGGCMNIQRWPSRSSTRYRRPYGASSGADRTWAPACFARSKCWSTSSTYTSTPSITHGTARPSTNRGVAFAAPHGAFVAGGATGEHDHATAARRHLGVSDSRIPFHEALAFAEPEGLREPIECGDAIFIREHRDDCGIFIAHLSRPSNKDPTSAERTAPRRPAYDFN